MEGTSLAYSFEDAKAKEPRSATPPSISRSPATAPSTTTAGSPASSTRPPWEAKPRVPLTEDVWELFDVRGDFSLANDLAAKEPGISPR